MNVLTFAEAIQKSVIYKKRHLLLGNGFSIACRPDIFLYGKLFEQADFSSLSPSTKDVFRALSTTDFERVIKTLRDTAILAPVYGFDSSIAEQMRNDANTLKELLVQTIAKSHPERPSDISDEEYSACQEFLGHFATIYTFNYDLLLYWTKMHGDLDGKIISDDGFRSSQDDIESGDELDYVVWEPGQSHSQDMWFLHGALHVFDSGVEIKQFTWNRTGVRLIEQIRSALSHDLFPLFVAEGSSSEKLDRIRHSDYLAKAYRSFQSISYCLFIYGHSLAENDEHYLKLIERGKVKHLFVGLHGDPEKENNKKIIRRAELMVANRPQSNPLKLEFYDTTTANVWNS
jgi:Domain of unknown function (DUF4917)